jgi:hypothetical protein
MMKVFQCALSIHNTLNSQFRFPKAAQETEELIFQYYV